jgi:hypothetical protein
MNEHEMYERVHKLIMDIKQDRYGAPLIAALHLCLDLAFELKDAQAKASEPPPQA